MFERILLALTGRTKVGEYIFDWFSLIEYGNKGLTDDSDRLPAGKSFT
jgi:hypothetical protein